MDRYIKAKIAYGYKKKGFSVKRFVTDFEHISGRKQIDFRVRKQLNNESRHGADVIKKLLESNQLDKKI